MKSTEQIINEYIGRGDWRVKENSTVQYSLGGLILSNSGNVTSDYWLTQVYDNEIAEAHRNADIHIHDLSMLSGYCFTGDTKIKTLDGNNYSFKELVEQGIDHFKVFSYDTNNQKVVIGDAHSPRITRQVDKLVKITLNTKQEIFCTIDHPFMLRDGSYLSAANLKPNMSLMPLYVNDTSRYCTVSKAWNNQQKKIYLHRWVAENYIVNRPLADNEVVHHIDGNKHNNTPENLSVMLDATHRAQEVCKTMQTDLWKTNNASRLTQYNKSAQKRLDVSVFACKRSRKQNGRFKSEIVYQPDVINASKTYNHGVRKVQILELDTPIDVYDITVDNYHNFALDCGVFVHNCAGWSLKQLIKEGLGGVPGKITSSPASHLSTLCNQMVNFLGIMQNEWAGAQAFSSFDTYLAPFVKIDNLTYKEVKQCIQSFIFGVNTPSRWGTQAPFTNITLDWTVPNDLAELNCIVGGKEVDFCYKDCVKEMAMVNKAFIEIMLEGDANGRGFQYPIPTYSITKDFDWSDTENNRLLFEMTAKYGTPYFSNYVNSDMEPSDVRSMAILGTQNLIYKDRNGRISKNEVRHLVSQWKNNPDTEYEMLMNGKFVKVVDMFEVPYDKYSNYVQINMVNGQYQNFSYDHKCMVVRDGAICEVFSQDVKTTDMMLLARCGYDETDIGTYEAGKIIGYYLAEGWMSHDDAEVDFAINDQRNDICEEIHNFFTKNFACRVSVDRWSDKHIYKVKVFSRAAVKFVHQFISGSCAIDKHIETTAYDTSLNFRCGIYDGYYATDGSEKAKIFAHTTNKNLCDDMIQLFATIGKYFKYQINKNNTRYFKADKSDKQNFVSYKLIPYVPQIFNDDYYIVGVDSMKLCDASRINTVYNFTVDTADHLYELPNGVITHQCCRLRLDLRELRKKSGGFFGSGESTGSVGVVTINTPRIAYLSKTKEEFYEKLTQMMDISARSLDIKRKAITQYLEEGLYPYTKRYLGDFHNHFSTIGLVGMNEACLNANWIKKDLSHPESIQFTKDVLNFMRNKLSDYQELYGDLFNLEATPAESTSYRLAKHDVEKYPDIITASSDCNSPYYTNSSHLPVGYTDDIFSALDIQDELQTLYTSGTVFHAFLGEKLPSWESAATLVRKIAENYKLPYYTLSPTYSVCAKCGYIPGEEYKCHTCGNDTEVYSRITGYYRPVQNWNTGKLQEFKERKEYVVEDKVKPVNKVKLYATTTCPNCKMAIKFLTAANVPFEEIFADKTPELAKEAGITQAPTLVVGDEKIVNVSNIRKWINDNYNEVQ